MSRELIVQVALAGPPTAASDDLTWTDVSAAVLAADGVQLQRGATSSTGTSSPGSASFTLNNTAGTYTPAALLRRAVRFIARDGGTDYPLGRYHVTDAVEFRQGLRRIQVTCSDVLALAAETNVGGALDHWLDEAGAIAYWPLDQDPPTPYRGGGSLLLVEEDVDGTEPATYGTVTHAAGGTGCPTPAGTAVLFEPADPGVAAGFTGLTVRLPPTAAFGLGFWMRVAEPWWPSGSAPHVGVSLDNIIEPNLSRGRPLGFGYSLPKSSQRTVCAALFAGGAEWQFDGDSLPLVELGNHWTFWDFRWDGSASTLTLTRPDGWTADLSAYAGFVQCDGWFSLSTDTGAPSFAGEWGKTLTLGGMRPRFEPALMAEVVTPAGTVEIAGVVITAGAPSAPSMAVASIGHPGDTAATRLARAATEAGWAADRITCGPFTTTLAGGDQDQRPLAAHVQAIEDTALGLAVVDASGNVVVVTRAEWESASPVATVSAGDLLLDADGVACNTGFLANVATVTKPDGSALTAANVGSRDTYGALADDRTMATSDADYCALAVGWLANNRAHPDQSYGLPQLVMQTGTAPPVPSGALFPGGGLLPGGSAAAYVVDCGDVVTVEDVAGVGSSTRVRVTGISWQVGKEGWRCAWYGRPDSTPDYFTLDTDSIDGPKIIGW